MARAARASVLPEAMLEQAGFANVVSSFQTDEVGAVRVFLVSWPAATHCPSTEGCGWEEGRATAARA